MTRIQLAWPRRIRGRSEGHRARSSRPVLESLERRECLNGSNWSMYNYDSRGSRNNITEHQLSASNVGQLGVAWNYPTAAPVAGTPAIVEGVVYAGDEAGNFYAINQETGALIWEKNVGAAVTDSPLVTPQGTVIIGDLHGNVWGLNGLTGSTMWEIHPSNDAGPDTAIWGSATQVGNDVVIGTASNEEAIPSITNYQANGSVVLINPMNGNILWQTYTIPPSAYASGWRGASVWSTPTYDNATKTIYVTTGNYFQQGTTTDPGVEDGVIALDARTGAIKWTNELVQGDIWNGSIVPSASNPDADIADNPKLFDLPDGTEAIGVGSKDGFYFLLNAATGAALNGPNATQLEVGGVLGGLYASGAVDQKAGLVFQNGLDWPYGSRPLGGDLYALSLTGTELWDFKTPAPNGSGVAIANGVVYFQSLDGTLYMLNEHATSASDALLATVNTGGQYSAPAVADGHVFLGTGNALAGAFSPGLTGSILCLGLPSSETESASAETATMANAPATASVIGSTASPAAIGLAPTSGLISPGGNSPGSAQSNLITLDNDLIILASSVANSAVQQGQLDSRKSPA